MRVDIIPVTAIIVEDRFRQDYGDLEELAQSIKERGLIQPLAVMQEGDHFRLLAGGRRYEACRLISMEAIPVRIYPEGLTELERKSIELTENLQRKDMTWAEEVSLKKAIHDIQVALHGEKVSSRPDAEGWSKRDTASLIGETHTNTADDIRLAEAMLILPDLANCETKAEANRMLKVLKKDLEAAVIAQEIQNKQSSTPIDIQRKKIIDSYIIGDFFDHASRTPEGVYDLIECDPPYAIDETELFEDLGTGTSRGFVEFSGTSYEEFITRLVKECRRLLTDQGWLIMWHAMHPWNPVIKQLLLDNGFKTGRPAIWYKPFTRPHNPVHSLGSGYEPFFYARKGNTAIANSMRTDVYQYNRLTGDAKVHPTEKPIELIQDIMSTFLQSNRRNTILIPFLGSGNSLLAAANLGHQAVGYELNADFKNHFIVKVQGGKPGDYRSLPADRARIWPEVLKP